MSRNTLKLDLEAFRLSSFIFNSSNTIVWLCKQTLLTILLGGDVCGVKNTADTSFFKSGFWLVTIWCKFCRFCIVLFSVTTWSFCLAIFHEIRSPVALSIIFSYAKQCRDIAHQTKDSVRKCACKTLLKFFPDDMLPQIATYTVVKKRMRYKGEQKLATPCCKQYRSCSW